MTKRSSSRSLQMSDQQATPADILPQSQVILIGEEEEQYQRILDEVDRSVRPVDIIEQFWVREITDLLWESLRLRRLKGNLLKATIRKGLANVLKPLTDVLAAHKLADDWFGNKPEARKEVDGLLEKANISFDLVIAEALAVKLTDIERIDRMIASAEGRRNTTLREISRHRDAVAVRLARVSEEIEEAEFSELDANDGRDGSFDD